MVKIAVLSDIHAYSKSSLGEHESQPSFVEISDPQNQPSSSPFPALEKLIQDADLQADLLICAGDLGDKAHPEAVTFAWDKVRALQGQLGASRLLVTSGNHDLDSRFEHNGHDARATLQGLTHYPFQDERLNDEYWARNVVVGVEPGYRWVVLNSSAFHGFNDEWRHGRVSKQTREYLAKRLAETGDFAVNILITHHHVYKLGSIDLDDYSEMTEGAALLSLLNSKGDGRWLIIHGHQHHPAISYANGSRGAPLVFSAGSFSAVLWAELSAIARNQFYLLDVEEVEKGYPIRGTFRAWDWIPEQGFSVAQPESGLPGLGGFGGLLNGMQLADAVEAVYNAKGEPFLKFDEVASQVPDLKYAMPDDFRDFRSALDKKFGLAVLDVRGAPNQIGRP